MSEAVTTLSLEALREAVRKGAAFRCQTRLHPDGGDGGKVFPPTYAGGVYAVEQRRIDGRVVRCVLLDSVQSQANRMEEALQDAFLPNWRELPTDREDPSCDLPVVAVHVENHGWVTSLTAPHRLHDAILRDSNLNGTRFRDSEIGQAIVRARLWNATPFYRYCPTALLFGTWDSTAGEGLDSAKIPRAIVSEIIGVDITPGVRTGSRLDPLGIKRQSATVYRLKDHEDDWTLIEAEAAETEKGEKKKFGKGKPSDINHGNVPPDMPRFERKEVRDQRLNRLPDVLESDDGETVRIRDGAVKPGGVTVAYALHTWTLSLTQLRRLRFPPDDKSKKHSPQGSDDPAKEQNGRAEAARTVLAALALYSLALLKDCGCWLRSRCELIPQRGAESQPVVLTQIDIDGTTSDFGLPGCDSARELLKQACEGARSAFGTGGGQPKKVKGDSEPQRLPNPGWEQRVIRLTPTAKLLELVRLSDKRQPQEESEEEEAAGAGPEG